ncbi:acyl-CoA Delta-9 desaturase-like [Microplitis mediator]|uniref:acyl-CoA Delta-9 desaturase-like n=1 Tax=Microplitis mediator TaxID=375433 RepID=UPI00255729A4|nr:acyl-CoA Delta-9 desaturase-like [Microplitis mediator]
MAPNNLTVRKLPSGNNKIDNCEITSVEKKPRAWYQFETDIIWKNSIFMIGIHLISLYYTITFPYFQRKILCVWIFVMVIMSGLGVTGGVHRLWTHRSYKANVPLRIFFATLYYSAGQNRIFNWVRDHRLHHKYTDTIADPHDNNRGFWFSHIGWLMIKKKPEVRKYGAGIDMSDILADPVVQFFDKNFIVLNTLLTFVIPVIIPVYFFNQDIKWSIISQIFLRYPWTLNITWSVNSFAHMFGYRRYDKNIGPVENIWVGWAAAGEGWHNYHHVFPWDYRAAEFKHVFLNTTTDWIDFFAKLGWATDLKTADPQLIKKVVQNKGDGSHPHY